MIVPARHRAFFDLFPAPEFLLLSTTGVTVTDSDTKFVQLRRQTFGNGFELAHASKINNPQGAVEAGLINKPDELVSVLKKLSSHFNIRYACATLPEEKVYLFTTSIEKVPFGGLRDAVAFIVEENVPVSLAESVFDFEIIDQMPGSNKIKLTVTVLPKDIVNAYITLFESAGITPISFDIESQAIARTLIHRGDRRPNLIINLSRKKTGFYVVEDKVVQFSTTSAYSIGEDDSYSNLNDLKAEMYKVLAFWDARSDKSGQAGKKIEKIILCGFGASKHDFVGKLMSGSEIPYVLADVWQNMSVSRSYAPQMSFDESLEYVSTVGLILPRDR
ncbi:MAG: hypothetical protein A3C70_00705 [Candidatus Zambryskibacteria bacterium RIFCSPHIGHO2_02_FULL_43_14]|uniref:SHS2 domain-containing protein n=1 Tax=Candidatus Zambryskibacteria bacterium RIFCSPHIGHO2_02_FULL_43_14 TaxID=1802748 RepID=A0A1G2TE09_9BACT|nr:MAG: hypothetical protein A2829_02750 [Candidatus Zambryskibacteria bacterium RIFCSPHIGHO2_01_FULL_43_60]OHA95534.1 MAG: hypothetical protein A3C70_00705 [Candidatus Zambryskibacteria bacterium RIFCSPHIGHO2_02_FULL_43_14]OHB02888.1 MAG: hypothetical protein A3B03_03145 [Candidatus Zambryskibacteria bacterium RIFCSPLOWO2_01_FULL_42_41]